MWRVLLVCLAACEFQHGSLQQQTPRDGSLIDGALTDAAGDSTMPMVDARPDATSSVGCSNTTCAAAGGTCNNNACEITAANGQPVNCPPSTRCDVRCPTDNQSCRNGMTCPAGSICTFTCEQDHTCDNTTLTCATGSTCEIFCAGTHSCIGTPISCATGATCKYHCCDPQACGSTFGCSGGGTCTDLGDTCQ